MRAAVTGRRWLPTANTGGIFSRAGDGLFWAAGVSKVPLLGTIHQLMNRPAGLQAGLRKKIEKKKSTLLETEDFTAALLGIFFPRRGKKTMERKKRLGILLAYHPQVLCKILACRPS